MACTIHQAIGSQAIFCRSTGIPVSFVISARNKYQLESPKSAPSMTVVPNNNAPSAPTITTIIPDGDLVGVFNVSWDLADTDMFPVDNVTVLVFNCAPAATDLTTPVAWNVTNDTSLTGASMQVNGGATFSLAANNPYCFFVFAQNMYGVGQLSPFSGANNLTCNVTQGTAAPGAVTVESVTSLNGSAIIAWRQPRSDGGVPIIAYSVLQLEANNVNTTTILPLVRVAGMDSPVVNVTVPNLHNGLQYTVTVNAINDDNQQSQCSQATCSSVVIPCDSPPAPAGVSATGGLGSIEALWSAAQAEGLCSVTMYSAVLQGVGPNSSFTRVVNTTNTFANWTDLQPGWTFRVGVTAMSRAGLGAVAWSGPATTCGPPGQPDSLSAEGGAFVVDVSWAQPSFPAPCPIQAYNVSLWHGNSTVAVATQSIPSNFLRAAFSNLNKSTEFQVVVVAINGVGPGQASSPAVATTCGVPSPPGAPVLVGSNGMLSIAWTSTSPRQAPCPVWGYSVRLQDMSLLSWVHTRSHNGSTDLNWDGLKANTEYWRLEFLGGALTRHCLREP